MSAIPGSAFLKGKDRIIRIADPAGQRPTVSVDSSYAWTITPAPTYLYFYGLVTADFTPTVNAQDFFLIGGNGWRDSVGTTKAGDMSCTSYLVKKVSAGVVSTDVEDALSKVLECQVNPDRELWVEEFNFLGTTSGSGGSTGYAYYSRAFIAGITNVRQNSPTDNLIQFSWDFKSRDVVTVGKRVEATQILLP